MLFWSAIKDYFLRCNHPQPNVLGSKETIEIIIKNKMSVARFGYGEFDMMLNINHPKFQRADEQLADRLIKVINSSDKNLLICIPNIFNGEYSKILTAKASRHWNRFLYKNRKNLYELFDFDKTYGDALFTRQYIDIKDKSKSGEYLELVRKIWDCRNVVIVEGRYTRFGVGNNLLENTQSVKRILCPERNAYDIYEIILGECKKIKKDCLVLCALGPTATVLVKDLCDAGYQAIDIGHLDIEYEWFLTGAKNKSAIANKYVNEANGIINIDNDSLYDDCYEKSIVSRLYK